MKQMFRLGGGVSQTKRYIIPVIFVILLLIITVGLSYAMYTFTGSGTKENVIQTGHIVITFNDVNNISITNRYPETDSEGLSSIDTNSQMTFTVTSDITGSTKVNYALGITDIQEGATLTQDYIKIYLKKGNNVVAGFTENKGELISSFKPLYIENIMDSHVLLTDIISGSEVHTYTLKAWIDENYKLPTDDDGYCYGFNQQGCVEKNMKWTNDGCLDERTNEENCNLYGGKYVNGGCLITKEMCEGQVYNSKWITTNVSSISETFKFKIKGYGTTESIKVEKLSLKQLILGTNNSNVLSLTPNLSKTYNDANDTSGLYVSIDTNDGRPTYYYRGEVTNNNLMFAGFSWKIVRINEDGSIRVLLSGGINNDTTYEFNSNEDNYTYMYYSNSDVEGGIKHVVDAWYDEKLKSYEKYIADTEFCEQFKVAWQSNEAVAGNVTIPLYSNYTSNFKCSIDANGYGTLKAKIGLLTYDEIIHAGNYPNHIGSNYSAYIKSNKDYLLLSPGGFSDIPRVWINGFMVYTVSTPNPSFIVSPVISLKPDTIVAGTGTADDPYIVK